MCTILKFPRILSLSILAVSKNLLRTCHPPQTPQTFTPILFYYPGVSTGPASSMKPNSMGSLHWVSVKCPPQVSMLSYFLSILYLFDSPSQKDGWVRAQSTGLGLALKELVGSSVETTWGERVMGLPSYPSRSSFESFPCSSSSAGKGRIGSIFLWKCPLQWLSTSSR